MRSRLAIALAITLTLTLASLLLVARSRRMTVTANASKPQATRQRKKIQPDLPGTINGATDPASITDTVAYELFMRSI